MMVTLKIKRQASAQDTPYWQEFSYDAQPGSSVADALEFLNSQLSLVDTAGNPASPIEWECSCLMRKCGACAMVINGKPRLACSAFFDELETDVVEIEPLSKFPLVKDLRVNRTDMFEDLKRLEAWLEEDAVFIDKHHSRRYESAKCLMCGCCLEVCPNFGGSSSAFTGAAASAVMYRIFNETKQGERRKKLQQLYRDNVYSGCSKSLSCNAICPAGLSLESLMSRSNAAALWGK